jgi:hypothetical protein
MPWQPDDSKTLFGVDPPPCECSDAMKISKTRRFRYRRARQHFATSTAVRDEARGRTQPLTASDLNLVGYSVPPAGTV